MAFCSNCGANLPEGAVQCPQCGTPLNAQQAQPQNDYQQIPPQGVPYQVAPSVAPIPPGYQQKSKMAAGLLGIFLGSLGVHNFYLGNTGKAVAQLLISILSCGALAFASGIWGLIEGIMILCGSIKVDGKNVPLVD